MSARVTQQINQVISPKEESSAHTTQQIVQYSRDPDVDPIFIVTAQIVQIAKGFFPRTIAVKTHSYPKLSQTSFFASRGEKEVTIGPNYARVSDQLVQFAWLKTPN